MNEENSITEIKKWLLVAHNAINHITVINLDNENDDKIHNTIHDVRNKLASIDIYIDEKQTGIKNFYNTTGDLTNVE
tara:strand:- start:435 stop:665 length:231 start_codon:yes stop_codon:yes gene_type:complete